MSDIFWEKAPPVAMRHIFDASEKSSARQMLVSAARCRKVSRILTFPAQNGLCAKLFASTWPKAEIIGIDNEERVVKNSELGCLSLFLMTNFSSLVNSSYPPRVRKFVRVRGETKDRPVLVSYKEFYGSEFVVGEFDLAFLDFCGTPSDRNMTDIPAFIRRHVARRGIVGITFTLKTGRGKQTSVDSVSRIIERETQLRTVAAEEYSSTSPMMLYIGEKC